MFHLREPYTPPIYVSQRRKQALVVVGADVGRGGGGGHGGGGRYGGSSVVWPFTGGDSGDSGEEYEAVPESPPSHRSGFPISGVGAAGMHPLSLPEKIIGGAYLALFLAGPPVIGYLAFGTLGAVGGTVLAAPAIYWVGSALLEG